ncbi:NEO1 [Mytilus edulis]|uniref:NEO1 n=1 Tax=Mytilus edulis TaxID=6550 RepID=A0A8S3Q1C1_MYTED|nr:NEO1 [Mytilus edulis]
MILLLFLTIGILHTVEGTEPAVEISYEEVARPYNRATLYSITCSVTHMPVNSNLWLSMISSAGGYVDDITSLQPTLVNQKPFWITVQYDSDSSVTVVFNDFIRYYEGQYTCVVRENTDDDPLEWSSKSVYLKYTTMPDIKDLIVNRTCPFSYVQRLLLNEGLALRVHCVASGVPEPKFAWKKKGNDSFVSEGSLLYVPSVTKTDSGFYFCEADNGIGGPVKSTELEVKVLEIISPQIKYTSEPVITFTEDSNDYWVKMEVSVNGRPHPTVSWWKETKYGREQIKRKRFRIRIIYGYVGNLETKTPHKLMIKGPREFQLGTYVVKAENSVGVDELKFTIRAAGTKKQR